MNFLSKEQKGAFYMIISGLLYGLLGYFGMTIIAQGFSRYNMLFWRFFIAGIFMFFLVLPKIKTFDEKFTEILKVFLFGAIFHGISVILYFTSAIYIGTGIAMVLFFIYPVIVMLFNRLFYKGKIAKNCYHSMLLILPGLILLVDITNIKFDLFGIIFGILNATFYAAYVVTSKKSKVSPIFATFTMTFGCASMALIFALFDHSFHLPNSSASWFNIIAMGVLCTALPILYFLKGLQYIDAAKASILSVSEPLAVMFFGYILLHEKITLPQLCGAIVILLGALTILNPIQFLKSIFKKNIN